MITTVASSCAQLLKPHRIASVVHCSPVGRMVHGLLEDPCGELFVGRVEADEAESLRSGGNGQLSAADAGAAEWHRGFQARASVHGVSCCKPCTWKFWQRPVVWVRRKLHSL